MARKLILPIALALCCAATRPVAAQAAAADTGLARAVATVLADSLFRGKPGRAPRVWDHSGMPLDSAVARIVTRDPRLGFRDRGLEYSLHIGIPRAQVTSDSARVLVRYEQSYAPPSSFLNWYSEENNHVFARGPGGWRYVRREFIRHGDGGSVRGR